MSPVIDTWGRKVRANHVDLWAEPFGAMTKAQRQELRRRSDAYGAYLQLIPTYP